MGAGRPPMPPLVAATSADWLLTETAAFFAGLGWTRADRADAPAVVAASVEFASACPTTAIAMRRPL